jgi:cation diffusion facilitator CzcD-associated flavoprotein CzcO
MSMQESVRVAVLGAGLSGVCMGIQLKKRGIENFVILEKAGAVGGTWRENTYPGVACDVPSHVYSYSFELNPDWSHAYSEGQEIWDYCAHCVEKYDLAPHIRFGTQITSVDFDGTRWQIATSAERTITADVVVSGLGGLHLPNHASINGLEDFPGKVFHTAHWDHDHDLAGRRVAIIGTGASAVQVLPGIANEVAEVTVFQRSAAWVMPRMAHDIPPRRRALFRRLPWLMRVYRWYVWAFLDVFGVLSLRRDGVLAPRLKSLCMKHLRDSVDDPEVRDKLTPHYDPGCKRRCISDDYLTSFNRDNVHLVTDAIVEVESGGIRDATGTLHALDTVIEATGFQPFDIAEYVDIRGRDGRRLQDVWKDHVQSFRTMMVPGFPNFFMLLGPNSATGHTSALIMIESQVQYVLRCLQFMNRHDIQHLDPDPEVTARYNERLQKDMQNMVFSGGCSAWYTDDSDYNFTLWPYSAARFLVEQSRLHPREFRKATR